MRELRTRWWPRPSFALGVMLMLVLPGSVLAGPKRVPAAGEGLLPTERIEGKGVWVDPRLDQAVGRGGRVRATIWFEDQFLGDGKAYERRAKEFKNAKRAEPRSAVIKTLKALAESS